MLISPAQLNQALKSGSHTLVFDCRFAMPAVSYDADYGHNQYLKSHIPTAIYVDLDKDLCAAADHDSGRHPLPVEQDFLQKLQNWGLKPGIKAVLYDDCGALIAGRLWWMLRYWVGHRDTAVLNGGFRAWCRAGLAVEEKVNTGASVDFCYKPGRQYLKSTVDVSNMLKQNLTGVLVDARGHLRFTGQEETIDPVAGHIPGAINMPCVDNLSAEGTFLSAEHLHRRFSPLLAKVDNASQIVHSCGSGVTACHNILAMEIAGMPGTSLYAGSWSEWIKNTANPIAVA